LKYELESFLRAVSTNTRPIVNGEDGRMALDVAQQIMNKIQIQRFDA
jgi:predicted dehydrogenase